VPVTAVALIIFAPTFALMFAYLYRSIVRRWPARRAWKRFLPAEAGLLLILAVVPNWVFAAFSLACAVLLAGLGMFCTITLVVMRVQIMRGRAKARARIVDDPAALVPSQAPPAAWLVGRAGELVAEGFRQTEHGVDRDGWTFLILFRDDDSVTAEVLTPPRDDPNFDAARFRAVELTSVFEGHRGVLCTNSRLPTHMSYWKGEIRQHFPGASVHSLIDEHERAVRLLAERGVAVARYPVERVHEERTWGLRMMATAQASTSSRVVLRNLKERALRPPTPFGRLEDDPALWERLRDLPPPLSAVAS
jgi:hypothetical protein